MKVLTTAQMREVDRRAIEEFGMPVLDLMESAGRRVVELLRRRFPDLPRRSVVVLCGKGNNGGDGLVVARLLRAQGCPVEVVLCADPAAVRDAAAVNLRRWQEQGGEVQVAADAAGWERAQRTLDRADIIVDALLGTGLNHPADGLLRTIIEDVNKQRPRAAVVAVDIPSGLFGDGGNAAGPAIRADYTVALAAPKLGEILPPGSDLVGQLEVGDIGIPRGLIEENAAITTHWIESGEFQALPLVRDRAAHKGSYGHVLLVAGSCGMTGAAVLAATGALRVGAGLVTVATPASVLPIVAAGLPEMLTQPLQETDAHTISLRNLDYGGFFPLLEGKSVLAMGPGVSTQPETQEFIRTVFREVTLPIILDADGLNGFAGRATELEERKSRLLAVTPHPGEMARLLGRSTAAVQARRLETAQEAARAWDAVVILKGQGTIVAAPDGRAFINSTGNPGMATGGTGDVLTGMLAGLTAQFGIGDWARILSLGVYLHGLAGDLAAAELGEHSLIASDLLRQIPQAFRRLAPPAPPRPPYA